MTVTGDSRLHQDRDAWLWLTLGIARLGDGDLRRWWGSHALDETGRYVLEGSFPRTWQVVGMELNLLSAVRRHADLLPRTTAVHLFSDQLPFRRLATAWLAGQKSTVSTPQLEHFVHWNAVTARETLMAWIGRDQQPKQESIGLGLFLGAIGRGSLVDDGNLDDLVRNLATAYLPQEGILRPPYFDIVA